MKFKVEWKEWVFYPFGNIEKIVTQQPFEVEANCHEAALTIAKEKANQLVGQVSPLGAYHKSYTTIDKLIDENGVCYQENQSFEEIIDALSCLVGEQLTFGMLRVEKGCRGNLDEGEYWKTFLEERYDLEMIFEGCYVVEDISSRTIQFFTGFDDWEKTRRVVIPAQIYSNTIGREHKVPLSQEYYKNLPSRRKRIYRTEYGNSALRIGFVLHYSDTVISITHERLQLELLKTEVETDYCVTSEPYWVNASLTPNFDFDKQGNFRYEGIVYLGNAEQEVNSKLRIRKII